MLRGTGCCGRPTGRTRSRFRASCTEVTPFSKIDDAAWLKFFNSWYPDETTRKMILVDNPAKLYRF